jgi:hypothetical protein
MFRFYYNARPACPHCCWQTGTSRDLKLTVNYRVTSSGGRQTGTSRDLKLTVNYRVPSSGGRQTGTSHELKLTVNYRVPSSGGRQTGTSRDLKLTVNYRVPSSGGRQTGTSRDLKLTVNYRVPSSGGRQTSQEEAQISSRIPMQVDQKYTKTERERETPFCNCFRHQYDTCCHHSPNQALCTHRCCSNLAAPSLRT